MHTLRATTLPSTSALAQIIAPVREDLARHLEEAEDATVRLVLAGRGRDVLGWTEELSTQLVAVSATWTWHSQTRGPIQQGAAVIQLAQGGRTAGEGWAGMQQHVITRPVTETDVQAAAWLIATGGVPVLAAEVEL